jgi:hypothetical protein
MVVVERAINLSFCCRNQYLLLFTVVVSIVFIPYRQLRWLGIVIYALDTSRRRLLEVVEGSGHDDGGGGKSNSSFFQL